MAFRESQLDISDVAQYEVVTTVRFPAFGPISQGHVRDLSCVAVQLPQNIDLEVSRILAAPAYVRVLTAEGIRVDEDASAEPLRDWLAATIGLPTKPFAISASSPIGQLGRPYDVVANFLGAATANDERRGQFLDPEAILADLRMPVMGSPPETWMTFREYIGSAGATVVSAAAIVSDRPILAVISGTSAALIWFLKPTARVLRRSLAERAAGLMNTEFRPEDER